MLIVVDREELEAALSVCVVVRLDTALDVALCVADEVCSDVRDCEIVLADDSVVWFPPELWLGVDVVEFVATWVEVGVGPKDAVSDALDVVLRDCCIVPLMLCDMDMTCV